MRKVVKVRSLKNFQIWLSFDDGTEGILDLSYLKGKGVFKRWDDPAEFERVSIGTSGELCWSDDIDLCPDSLYLRLTGKKPEEIFQSLKKVSNA
ncbi:MAG: DUF2442 domain-containing protein [Pseudomonadota bacterium]